MTVDKIKASPREILPEINFISYLPNSIALDLDDERKALFKEKIVKLNTKTLLAYKDAAKFKILSNDGWLWGFIPSTLVLVREELSQANINLGNAIAYLDGSIAADNNKDSYAQLRSAINELYLTSKAYQKGQEYLEKFRTNLGRDLTGLELEAYSHLKIKINGLEKNDDNDLGLGVENIRSELCKALFADPEKDCQECK